MIYLACPYAHPDSNVQHRRYTQVTARAAELMRKGHVVYSPITSMHFLSQHHAFPGEGNDFWLRHDLAILARCDKLLVLQLEGWEQSEGLRREIEFATEKNIPIEYIGVAGGKDNQHSRT